MIPSRTKDGGLQHQMSGSPDPGSPPCDGGPLRATAAALPSILGWAGEPEEYGDSGAGLSLTDTTGPLTRTGGSPLTGYTGVTSVLSQILRPLGTPQFNEVSLAKFILPVTRFCRSEYSFLSVL